MGIENVIKKIHVEPINRKAEYEAAGFLTREEVTAAMDRVADQVRCNMEYFGTRFPSSATRNQTYGVIDNIEWTDGFWTGLLWLCYEYTGDDAFKNLALKNVDSFLNRVEKRIELDHHDLGFLYSLSCVAGYKLTGSAEGRKAGLLAADKLMERFQEKGGFIQAWGRSGDPKEYRLIIDSLLNLPLLYTAAEITGEQRYREIAGRHYENVIRYIIREDGSTYHTYYFDSETGAPSHGATHQGYSDNSCWARGQAWAIYGMPLHVRVSGRAFTPEEQERHDRVVRYFLEHLPANGMPYWDLVFKEGDGQPWDSSALAVAACGMLEMGDREKAEEMLKTCRDFASSEAEPDSEGLLLHGVYAYGENKGVDEPNLWGDYFYMEGLLRLANPDWIPFL